MDGLLFEGEPAQVGDRAVLTSGIFRRELMHATEPTNSCIIWVAGMSGDGERFDPFIESLNDAGFDVLRFGGWSGQHDLAPLAVHDLLIALQDTLALLSARGYTFIGYVGKSFGALLGLLSRTRYDRMVLWAPAVKVGSMSDTHIRCTELERLPVFSLSEEALAEKNQPTLIINGATDTVFPPHEARLLAASLADAQRIEVPEGHSVDRTPRTLEATLEYLTK